MNEKYKHLLSKVKARFMNEESSHDWYHIERVMKMSTYISDREGGNKAVINYASLLHDIDDHKFNGGDFDKGSETAFNLIQDHPLSEEEKELIRIIIRDTSFKGSGEDDSISSLEGKIVQDADRLDAIGAIGIARTFAYGGSIGQPIYHPDILPTRNQDRQSYLKDRTHTINHFYEKLLLLKDLMNTETGRQIALDRTQYMSEFLDQFYREWKGPQ